jgi:hypothetical protein
VSDEKNEYDLPGRWELTREHKCHECGQVTELKTLAEERTVAGRKFKVSIPTHRCAACGRGADSFSHRFLAAEALGIALLLFAEERPFAPKMFRWMRKAAGVGLPHAQELLGITKDRAVALDEAKDQPTDDELARLKVLLDEAVSKAEYMDLVKVTF